MAIERTREICPREKHPKGLAMSVVKLAISSPIVRTRRAKTRIRRRTRLSRRTSTRPTRRSTRVKLTSARSGIPTLTPTPMMKESPPSPFVPLHQQNHYLAK
jgi:hypothetical protein